MVKYKEAKTKLKGP